MYDVTVNLRNKMLQNDNLTAFVGTRIYPNHISIVSNPVFPLITLSRVSGGVNEDHISSKIYHQIDVWCKDIGDIAGYDLLWSIYNEVRNSINLKTDMSDIQLCKEYDVNDNLYESDTETYHLSARYQIITHA